MDDNPIVSIGIKRRYVEEARKHERRGGADTCMLFDESV